MTFDDSLRYDAYCYKLKILKKSFCKILSSNRFLHKLIFAAEFVFKAPVTGTEDFFNRVSHLMPPTVEDHGRNGLFNLVFVTDAICRGR